MWVIIRGRKKNGDPDIMGWYENEADAYMAIDDLGREDALNYTLCKVEGDMNYAV